MSLLENTSLDMPDITDNISAMKFVKEPNVQQLTDTRETPKAMIFAPITPEHVSNIQSYLKDNNDVADLINEKYTGPVDGEINEELKSVASKLEFAISKIINKNVGSIILNTTAKDLKISIKTIQAYKNLITPNKPKLGQDERIYQLGKLLIKQNKK